jgi:TRAP-type C4-dicarboxylate transport system substrate-binding protein
MRKSFSGKILQGIFRVAAFVLTFFTFGTVIGAPSLPVMRISVENTLSHSQTRAVKAFADKLSEKLSGRITVEFYPEAQLFRGKDVISAIGRDKVEMAVPGSWQIDRFEPDVGILLLPFLYGRSSDLNHRLLDGPFGTELNKRIEETLGVKVLGRWIDLGHAHLYSVNKPINSHEDIAGMRLRVAGGVANGLRIEALGGQPRVIAWPDLPAKLGQGVVDGLLTTHGTVASAKLWESGVRFAFEDNQYFPQYVPLINRKFWSRLPADVREIIADLWEQQVEQARENAAVYQVEARRMLQEHDIRIITPAEDDLREWRERLLKAQPGMIEAMRIDPDLVEMIDKELTRLD